MLDDVSRAVQGWAVLWAVGHSVMSKVSQSNWNQPHGVRSRPTLQVYNRLLTLVCVAGWLF